MSLRYSDGIISAFFDPLRTPDAPTIGTATAGEGSASITFTAPANVGGSAITGYVATAYTTAGVAVSATGSASPISITGLTVGTAYTIKVAATNSYGTGPESAASGSVTPTNPYVEDVFSTYLYTGQSTGTITVNNGIDLSGKGGLVWIKARSGTNGASSHSLADTTRGITKALISNTTGAETTEAYLSSVTSTGFTLPAGYAVVGNTGTNYVSWTFREQPKFFDIVTYTGDGSNRTIAHNLGSAPGCMFVKCTSDAVAWNVYHRSLTSAAYQLELNTTSAEFSDPTVWNSTAPTSSVFSVGTNLGINGAGRTYVAYLFAHNAGGFGLSGTENVISCGSYTGNGGTQSITLGYEPQWVMIKRTDTTFSWPIVDVMRGWVNSSTITDDNSLYANLSNAEDVLTARGFPNATGFTLDTAAPVNVSGGTYIYIAIRRPMKTPTTGTEVFRATTYSGSGIINGDVSVGITADMVITKNRAAVYGTIRDRLRGNTVFLVPSGTDSDTGTNNYGFNGPDQTKIYTAEAGTPWNATSNNYIAECFKRAPGFFDVVCYTGTGTAGQTYNHNLGVTPELMIVKNRISGVTNWAVYSATLGATQYLTLNTTNAASTALSFWNNTIPTSSVFSVGTAGATNNSGDTLVAYLFATVAGVSKVGSYTGTGATLNIDAGFTTGARFVMIKRTDSTGDWFYWDTSRGMVAGSDPRLAMNLTSAESNANWVYTATSGFQIVTTDASVNASGGTYIYLAIA